MHTTMAMASQARSKYLALCADWRNTFQAMALSGDAKQQEKAEAHKKKMQAAEKEANDAVAAANKAQERVYAQELPALLQVRCESARAVEHKATVKKLSAATAVVSCGRDMRSATAISRAMFRRWSTH